MRVPFDDIPDPGLQRSVSDTLRIPGDQGDVACSVAGEMFLQRKGPDRILVTGTVQAVFPVCCDRCLESFPVKIHEEVQVICELVSLGDEGKKEHHLEGNELDMVFSDEPIVRLDAICRDQILLAASGKRICKDACKGLCPGCGINLNIETCECHQKKTASPFTVLAEHIKK